MPKTAAAARIRAHPIVIRCRRDKLVHTDFHWSSIGLVGVHARLRLKLHAHDLLVALNHLISQLKKEIEI